MQPGDRVIVKKSGTQGVVKREAWGDRVVIEIIGNISGQPREVVLDKSAVRKA